ncbi:hypothetical protein NSTC745_06416 [Nostoc sp. DSM 114161]|jgi:hypothetical protein|uniref:hypothetical protein n=1 Tax=Nostoc sp. DSM 114161 TaxID=3440143 RepID=UPI0040453C50
MATETPYRKVNVVDGNGDLVSFGGGSGGGGDASATNQQTEITRLTEIRDRLPSVAASETTLQQVRDAIKAQIDIASTIWTDNSGAFYVRRDLVNEGTGTITVSFTDPSGSAATPGAGLRPLATTDKDTITDFYDVLTGGTGYSVGDLLARVAILDANSGTPAATFIWLNLTAGTILSSAPTSANIERANESIGARQIGTWNFNLPAGAASQSDIQEVRDRIGNSAVSGATMPTGGVGLFGWLSAIYLFLTQRMPALISGRIPVDVQSSIVTAIAPSFTSLTLTSANTEYFFAFTSVKKYAFKVLSGGGGLRFTNVTNKVAGPTLPYYTLDSTAEEVQDFGNCTFTGTLYFASSTPGTTVLIQYWG